MCSRHERECCLQVDMRGEEKYCLRRWCFSLLHCRPSKAMTLLIKCLFNSVCQKDDFFGVGRLQSLVLCNYSAEMDKEYSTQVSPKSLRGSLSPDPPTVYSWLGSPHTFFSMRAPRWVERAALLPHYPHCRGSRDLWFVENLAAVLGRKMETNRFLAVPHPFKL